MNRAASRLVGWGLGAALVLMAGLSLFALPGLSVLAQTSAPPVSASAPGQPQALPVEQLVIQSRAGPVPFRVQVADTFETREKGLMFVKHMADSDGMIFNFEAAEPQAFWMRNTFIPLDILFIDDSGRVLNIIANAKPFDETPLPSTGPARAVLEINGGLAARLGVHPGDRVSDEKLFHR